MMKDPTILAEGRAKMSRQTKRKVFLINDTYLTNGHFGCELVSATFREQFARVGLEMIGSSPGAFSETKYAEKLRAADLIVVNGEGSLHHNRHPEMLEVAGKYPSVLVNSVFEANDDVAHLLKNFLFISCRESLSAEYIRSFGYDAVVNPDVTFSSMALRSYTKDAPKRDVGFTDSVKRRRIGLEPLVFSVRYGFAAHCRFVDYLAKLCAYRRLCVGRFHGVVAASVLGIPFSSWESNTWKIRGLMGDMGVEYLHFDNQEEARKHVPDVMPDSIREFAKQAVLRIDKMFEDIAEIALSV